jgi:ADP-ribose pyrophosphatase YjhB (NUDIX family)
MGILIKMNIDRAGVILFSPNKKYVLLVKTKLYGNWGFPKGKVEKNENLNMCAMRELKEETGLTINIDANHITNIIPRRFNNMYNKSYYYCYILNNNMMINIINIIKSHKSENGEIDKIGFIPIDKCDNLKLNKDIRRLLPSVEYCQSISIKL